MDAVTKPNAPATIAAQAETHFRRSISSDAATLSSTSTLVDDNAICDTSLDDYKLKSVILPGAPYSKLKHVEIPKPTMKKMSSISLIKSDSEPSMKPIATVRQEKVVKREDGNPSLAKATVDMSPSVRPLDMSTRLES